MCTHRRLAIACVALAALAAPGGAFRPAPSVARLARAQPRAAPLMAVSNVKTIETTVKAFNANYKRPIIPVWRSPLSDMLQVTHLSLVDGRFKWDNLASFGLVAAFDFILAAYPMDEEKAKIRDASIKALDLDLAEVLAEHAAIKTWLEGKTADEMIAAIADGSAPISKKDDSYMQSRSSNMAVVLMAESGGAELSDATAEKWAAAMGLRSEKLVKNDMNLYKSNKDKMEQGMQMMKALEIREKKRMADNLEEKAKAAQAAAEKAAEKAKEADSA